MTTLVFEPKRKQLSPSPAAPSPLRTRSAPPSFVGVINGARLEALIEHTGTLQYAFQAKAVGASFTGTQNPAYVTLPIGGDSGATSVRAETFH